MPTNHRPTGSHDVHFIAQVVAIMAALLPVIGLATRLITFSISIPNGPSFIAACSASLSELSTAGFLYLVPSMLVGLLWYKTINKKSVKKNTQTGLKKIAALLGLLALSIFTLLFLFFVPAFINALIAFVTGVFAAIWTRKRKPQDIYSLLPLIIAVTIATVVNFSLNGVVPGVQAANYKFLNNVANNGRFIELGDTGSAKILRNCRAPYDVIQVDNSSVTIHYDVRYGGPTLQPSLYQFFFRGKRPSFGIPKSC